MSVEEFNPFAAKASETKPVAVQGDEQPEQREQIEEVSITLLPLFDLKSQAKIESGKIVEFLEDVSRDDIIAQDENNFSEALDPLKKAGVTFDYQPWISRDQEDFEGWVTIDKDSLNQAIREGKITFRKNEEDGDYELVS